MTSREVRIPQAKPRSQARDEVYIGDVNDDEILDSVQGIDDATEEVFKRLIKVERER
ncbi:uncharacterized protein K452DRAFT_290915 [Aplosporella prunicola CBS 121167]|uniref:Uncharacterized protein n=1 Tax=Aplosporella prunicola CBS 121167 TaxID=1176127 RepID=A0A6A6B2C1_9PEZI|nr:uncharacterized protein K452DRAFT_290915 [Aplosporella prunicola CBS 121167]KAF2138329.1 hypothetical protein K452DRAFT_290915 [Aplosporella prunicola CBS 121167]